MTYEEFLVAMDRLAHGQVPPDLAPQTPALCKTRLETLDIRTWAYLPCMYCGREVEIELDWIHDHYGPGCEDAEDTAYKAEYLRAVRDLENEIDSMSVMCDVCAGGDSYDL